MWRRDSQTSAAMALLATMTLATMTACPPVVEPPPPPPPDDECKLDLNFDTTGATLLAGEPVSGVLCPAFDQDLFAFDIANPGTIVTIDLSMEENVVSRVNPAYRIVRDNGSPEGAPTPFSGEDPSKSSGEATDFSASHRIEEPGRYYVLVFDARFVDDAFDITNPYTLGVTLTDDPDDNEDNNTPATATPVTTGTVIAGQIATTNDEDWFVVSVPAGAKLVDLELSAAADTGIEHEVVVFEADGQTQIIGALASDTGPVVGSSSLRLRTRVAGGTDTLILVRDKTGDNATLAAGNAYSLTVNVIDNPDLNETPAGNDVVETATTVTSGTELTASLASTADQDIYRIRPPANASRANPSVLIISIDMPGVDVRTFRPQVSVLAVDPEAAANQQGCRASCAACDQDVCKDARLQRFIPGGGYQTAVALRDPRDLIIALNEFGDDAFQDGAGYTIAFEVVADPDPDEGDDVLIPNLEFAGFANEGDLARQFQESKGRARVLSTNYPPVCTGTGDPAGCLPLVDVPTPIPGVSEAFTRTVDCSAAGTGAQTVVASGRLTFEGDRDYFRLDVPSEGYWGLDFNYQLTGASTTPVELTLFVRADNGLIANTLEAEQTLGTCLDTVDCPAGSICVDGACWADGDGNPTFASHIFPEADECAFVSVVDRGRRPLYLEVTDNGINDFDVDVAYRFSVTVRCGCPTSCNRGAGNCQGVAAPR